MPRGIGRPHITKSRGYSDPDATMRFREIAKGGKASDYYSQEAIDANNITDESFQDELRKRERGKGTKGWEGYAGNHGDVVAASQIRDEAIAKAVARNDNLGAVQRYIDEISTMYLRNGYKIDETR